MKAVPIILSATVLFTACGRPGQLPATTVAGMATVSVAGRAGNIYFAGVQSAQGGGGFLGDGELGAYSATANGNVAPLHTIAGNNTGLNEAGGCCVPQSASFDPVRKSIWSCRTFSKLISEFSIDAWGNVKPTGRLVISPKTVSCGGVAIAPNGDIVADDINAAFIATWRSGSTGKTAPIRKIAGPATQLYLPSQITFDSKGNYIVTDRCSPPQCSSTLDGEVLTFAANANGNASPLRALVGSKTLLAESNRVTYDSVHGMIYVANLSTSTVTGYPANSSGNVAPTIYIHGSKTHLWNPDAIAIDRAGFLYVGNEPEVPGPPPAGILVFAPGANGNDAPVRVIQGSKTGLAEVNGLSVY